MFELPKRPGPYIIVVLLAVLGTLVFWMFSALSSPEVRRAAGQKKAAPSSPRPPEPGTPLPAGAARAPASQEMDPHLATLAARLNSRDHEPEHDLEILEELLSTYRRALGGNPSGDNSDIAAALIGDAPRGAFFPRQSTALRDGQILDRWGTPYWFHPINATTTEIRSAGPDRQLFTSDDIVLNPSPPGLGVTPEDGAN